MHAWHRRQGRECGPCPPRRPVLSSVGMAPLHKAGRRSVNRGMVRAPEAAGPSPCSDMSEPRSGEERGLPSKGQHVWAGGHRRRDQAPDNWTATLSTLNLVAILASRPGHSCVIFDRQTKTIGPALAAPDHVKRLTIAGDPSNDRSNGAPNTARSEIGRPGGKSGCGEGCHPGPCRVLEESSGDHQRSGVLRSCRASIEPCGGEQCAHHCRIKPDVLDERRAHAGAVDEFLRQFARLLQSGRRKWTAQLRLWT
jgi:hypothetical protein